VDYSDRIDAVRVNLSSVIDNGVDYRTAVTTAVDTVNGGVDTDTLISVEWAKTGSGDDWIVGSADANRLEGGLGDDWLRGGLGNDTLVGGLDTDTVDYSDAASGVTITIDANSDGTVTGGADTDVLEDIENFVGSAHADSIDINDSNDNWIDLGSGADEIYAGAGDDTIIFDAVDSTIDGEAGTDTLVVRDANLDLTSGNGPDISSIEVIDLRGSLGTLLTLDDSSVTGLTTSLTVYADSADIIDLVGSWTLGSITTSDGGLVRSWSSTNTTVEISVDATVRLNGTSGNDNLDGSTNADLILGLGGNDSLDGKAGDDTFIGSAGDDTIIGGDGVDTVDYSSLGVAINVDLSGGSVTVTGGGTDDLSEIESIVATVKSDTLQGSTSDDVIYAGSGNDTLSGHAGDDRLYAEAGDDSILGGAGSDILHGGDGSDTLEGGDGSDALFGDAGNDFFVLDFSDSVVDGGTGTDTLEINDSSVDFTNGGLPSFDGIEILDIENPAATSLTLDLESVRALSSESDHLWIVSDADDSILLKDYANWDIDPASYEGDGTSLTGETTQILSQDGVILKITTKSANSVANVADVVDDTPIGSGSTYLGTDNPESLSGSSLNDTFTPSAGADTVAGGDGIDTLQLGPQFRIDTVSLGFRVGFQNNSYLVAVGDVNADGFMDFAVRDEVSSQTNLTFVERNTTTTGYPNYTYTGAYARLSTSNYGGGTETQTTGDVYIVFGESGGLGSLNIDSSLVNTNATSPYIKLSSSAAVGEGFGEGLGSLGDFDGDGAADLMVVASGGQELEYSIGNRSGASVTDDEWTVSSEGRLYLFNGGNEIFTTRASGSVTETTLSTSGGSGATQNANVLPTTTKTSGWDSVSNGAYTPQYASDMPGVDTTYSYTTSSTTADVVFKGDNSSSQLGSGWSPVSLGDINGDGYDDIISGSTGELFLGHNITASGFNQDVDDFGAAIDLGDFNRLASLGDVDGDGLDDFLASDDSGRTNFIIWGSSDAEYWTTPQTWGTNFAVGTVPHMTKIVSEDGLKLNGAFSSLGDINGDGFDDLLISAKGDTDPNDFNAKDNGGLYVVFGQAGHWNEDDLSLADLAENQLGFRITGAVDLDKAGEYSWTGVGDMNGDGLDDFIFQAPGDAEADNVGTTSNGSSYLLFGRESGWQDISLLEMQDYGIQLLDTPNGYWTALGDIDGDGFDDVSLTQPTSMQIMYGGAFLTSDSNQAVQTIQGTGGETLQADADVTSPNPTGADRLIGNAGNDTLVGDGGLDVLIGGAGDDLLEVEVGQDIDGNDLGAFFKIDGGTGIDTVRFTTDINLNFTRDDVAGARDVRNGAIENIEIFDLGTDNQTLTLGHLDIIELTGQKNTAVDNTAYQKGNVLVINGGVGDAVDLQGDVGNPGDQADWTVMASAEKVNGSGSFSIYQYGSDNIYAVIANDIAVS
jgi:Ca2+-binding RTX toxin-like protein